MTRKVVLSGVGWAAMAVGLGLASAVMAQTPAQTRARATTQSLNSGPGDSRLGDAPPTGPLPARSPRPARPRASSGDAVTDLLNQLGEVEPAEVRPRASTQLEADDRPEADAVTRPATDAAARASTGEMTASASALPPLPLGYYVRDGKDCNSIWPGDGDLAWLSAVAFTIDFGGCDPSVIQQLSDTTWEERQQCRTELGNDGPPNIVQYEVTPEGELVTRTRLGETALGREERWAPCAAGDLPPEARFAADDPGRHVADRDAGDAV